MPKSSLLEASDYLAYAILQHLIDPDSQKAKLTAPMLEASKPMGDVVVDKENADYLIEDIFGEEIPTMNWEKRAFILEEMKTSLEK